MEGVTLNLLKRREEIISDHKAMEKYHPHWKTEMEAGRSLSTRPIAFLCDDEVVVIGDDVTKIIEGLEGFINKFSSSPRDNDRAKREPTFAVAVYKASRLIATKPTEIRVSQNVWNAYTLALGEVGVEVVLTDGSFLPGE